MELLRTIYFTSWLIQPEDRRLWPRAPLPRLPQPQVPPPFWTPIWLLPLPFWRVISMKFLSIRPRQPRRILITLSPKGQGFPLLHMTRCLMTELIPTFNLPRIAALPGPPSTTAPVIWVSDSTPGLRPVPPLSRIAIPLPIPPPIHRPIRRQTRRPLHPRTHPAVLDRWVTTKSRPRILDRV